MFRRFRIRPSKLFSRPSQSCIFSQPGETPFDIDPPRLLGYSLYSVIKPLLLQRWTSGTEFTSKQLYRTLLTARILSCQLSISGTASVPAPTAFFRLWLDLRGLMLLIEYLSQSSGCKTHHRFMKCVVEPQLIHFCVIYVPHDTRSCYALTARALVIVLLAMS